jgi:hypothetical protein
MSAFAHTLRRKSPREKAATLVVTLLVLTLLSAISVAFIQSVSSERSAARSTLNRYNAELAAEAGIQTALSIYKSNRGPNLTLSLNRTSADPEKWSLQYNTVSLNGSILSSNSSLPTTPPPIPNETHTFQLPTGNRTAPKYPIVRGNQTIGAFSYVVIDNTAKQSLDRFPGIPTRNYSTSLREIPFINLDLSPANSLSADSQKIADLPSEASANLLFGQNLGIDTKWVNTRNFTPNLAPDGGPKLNLRRLKFYVDSRAITQTANNPKSQIVEALLGQASSVNATSSWGGGGLSWLISPSNPRPYTLTEARQIAANLIDYIDADLHPTTDNVDAPTYFGTEGRPITLPDLTVVRQGHPYVTTVGCGLVFNLSNNATTRGGLNSTRVLAFWSLVNPWSNPIALNLGSTYTVNITIRVSGNATGGNLGSNASAYFLPLSSEPPYATAPSTSNERLTEGPTNILSANFGSTFPQSPSGMSYANFYDLRQTPGIGTQPAGMTFSNLNFIISRLRLSFTDSEGRTSVVQNLDRLGTIPIPFHLSSFTLPSTVPPNAIVYNPGTVRNGLFLNGDPRLNFRADQWVLGNMTAASASSTTPPEKTDPAVNMFSGMSLERGDGQQGLSSNHTWYTQNSDNHFFVRSPPVIPPAQNPATTTYNATAPVDGQIAMESVAEMGYLSTGRPWQTLRMVVDPANQSGGGDFAIMDFIQTGTDNSTTIFGSPNMVYGKINPNTLLRPTAQGLFNNIPGISSSQSEQLATLLSTSGNFTGYPFTRPSALGALPQIAVYGATTKFAREELMRRIANLLTTQSSDYLTILSYGESRNPLNNSILSKSYIKANIGLTSATGGTPVVNVISRKIE